MQKNEIVNRLLSADELPKNFLRFYAVGLVLFMVPFTRTLFVHITAISILLVVFAVFYHHKLWNLKTVLIFSFVVLSSFFLEAAGVATGKLFGIYSYDSGLGIKAFNTPLIIGINWLFLVYASQAIMVKVTNNKLLKIIGGAILMTIYDSVMELAAPSMNMWHFDTFYPPVENFLMWFVASSFFHSLFVFFRIDVDNKPARALFWSQLLFFVIITVFSLLFIR